jgi:hypothetical protein
MNGDQSRINPRLVRQDDDVRGPVDRQFIYKSVFVAHSGNHLLRLSLCGCNLNCNSRTLRARMKRGVGKRKEKKELCCGKLGKVGSPFMWKLSRVATNSFLWALLNCTSRGQCLYAGICILHCCQNRREIRDVSVSLVVVCLPWHGRMSIDKRIFKETTAIRRQIHAICNYPPQSLSPQLKQEHDGCPRCTRDYGMDGRIGPWVWGGCIRIEDHTIWGRLAGNPTREVTPNKKEFNLIWWW